MWFEDGTVESMVPDTRLDSDIKPLDAIFRVETGDGV